MDGSAVHIDITAYHEAGHAVCALWHKRYVEFVSVSYRSPGAGLMWYSACSQQHNPFNPWVSSESARAGWDIAVTKLQQDMRILLAGPLAEAKAVGKPLRSLGTISDLEKCRWLANRFDKLTSFTNILGSVPNVCGIVIVNQARSWTRRWVGNPRVWQLIESVTMELASQGRLDAAQLGDIVSVAYAPAGQTVLQSGSKNQSAGGGSNSKRLHVSGGLRSTSRFDSSPVIGYTLQSRSTVQTLPTRPSTMNTPGHIR